MKRIIIIGHNRIAVSTATSAVKSIPSGFKRIITTDVPTAPNDVVQAFETAWNELGGIAEEFICILEGNAGKCIGEKLRPDGTKRESAEYFVFKRIVRSPEYQNCQFVFFTTTPSLVKKINGLKFSGGRNVFAAEKLDMARIKSLL